MYVTDYAAQVSTTGEAFASWAFDHLESAVELIYLFTFPYEFAWCNILCVYRYALTVLNVKIKKRYGSCLGWG